MKLMRCWVMWLFVLAVAATVRSYGQSWDGQPSGRPVIVSPLRPKDSRGETVYEAQGADQKNEPIVPGVLVRPILVKMPAAKYPKALRKEHQEGDVTLEGVITPEGDLIDTQVSKSDNPLFSDAALKEARKCRFRPATLNGRPVAILARVTEKFRLR
jgi:TonB family protein